MGHDEMEVISTGYGVSSEDDKNALKLIVVMIVQLCEDTTPFPPTEFYTLKYMVSEKKLLQKMKEIFALRYLALYLDTLITLCEINGAVDSKRHGQVFMLCTTKKEKNSAK